MKKGSVRKLSGSERLHIANQLSGRAEANSGDGTMFGKIPGVLVPNLARSSEQTIQAYGRQAIRGLARNSFERVVASLISPKELLSTQNNAKRRFLFRCFFVPQFAILECGVSRTLNANPKDHLPPWWIFEPASYVLAFERTFLWPLIASICPNSH